MTRDLNSPEGSRSGRFPMETFPAPELRPGTTRLRVVGIPPMAERLGLRPAEVVVGVQAIMVTPRVSVADPLDTAPIYLPADQTWLAARGWFIRLAVWYLRRYVADCRGEKS
jgi:hypothetical protein